MSSNRITILHDSFGRRGDLRKDWGFAALVEFGGRRILFDAGNDARTFAENTDSLGVDLRSLDFAVISHRHGDHTSGLDHLLRVNPTIAVYPRRDLRCFRFQSSRRLLSAPPSASPTHAVLRRPPTGNNPPRDPMVRCEVRLDQRDNRARPGCVGGLGGL